MAIVARLRCEECLEPATVGLVLVLPDKRLWSSHTFCAEHYPSEPKIDDALWKQIQDHLHFADPEATRKACRFESHEIVIPPRRKRKK